MHKIHLLFFFFHIQKLIKLAHRLRKFSLFDLRASHTKLCWGQFTSGNLFTISCNIDLFTTSLISGSFTATSSTLQVFAYLELFSTLKFTQIVQLACLGTF